jgi:hypothetical protein
VRRPPAVSLSLALLAAGCTTAPPVQPLAPAEADRFVTAWEARRAEAYAPRRLKALFRGEAAPKFGVALRGYLSVFWDGTTLVWKASAPLAGNAREGRLTRGVGEAGDAGAASPLPGTQSAADAIGALLGVLDLPAAGRPVERVGDGARIRLDSAGREALLTPDGRVLALSFPGKARVSLEAAAPFPLKVSASGPRGSATLVLESWADWPPGEPIPGGTR